MENVDPAGRPCATPDAQACADEWPAAIRFLPWIGAGYGRPNALGLPPRLLVLGISHHRRALAQGGLDILLERDLTRRIVARHVEDGTFRFFTLVRRTVLGPASPAASRGSFWHGVAFYNLVQRLFERPYEPVPAADVRASHAAFTDVLARLGPSHVLVTGLDLWRQMPPADAQGRVIEAAGSCRDTAVYGAGAQAALAMAVPHPASFGFTYEPWHTLIGAFLRERAMSGTAMRSAPGQYGSLPRTDPHS